MNNSALSKTLILKLYKILKISKRTGIKWSGLGSGSMNVAKINLTFHVQNIIRQHIFLNVIF